MRERRNSRCFSDHSDANWRARLWRRHRIIWRRLVLRLAEWGPAAEKFELASLLLKITFPYLWFITFVALSGAILNTLGKFAVSSFTPVFLNVMMILCAWYLSPNLEQPEVGLAIGVFLGGLVQFLFQLPFLIKAGVLVRPKWAGRSWGGEIRTLMIPALFGVSVSQINLLFDSFVASFLQTGSISWLYYSDRLLEFPLGLFGIAIATVILPALSRKHVDAHSDGFAHTMDWAFAWSRFSAFLPCWFDGTGKTYADGAVYAREFTPSDVEQASYSLLAYSSGLLSFMLIKVLAPGYYSRQDTKPPYVTELSLWSAILCLTRSLRGFTAMLAWRSRLRCPLSSIWHCFIVVCTYKVFII